jgi:hypothetical protein
MPYRNERLFSEAVLRELNKKRVFNVRIETGTTSRGVPDIYCRLRNTEVWLELKNTHQSIYASNYTVPYRPGQEAWHYRYFRAAHLPVLTFVACRDGFFVYPVTVPRLGTEIISDMCYSFTKLSDIWEVIKITHESH